MTTSWKSITAPTLSGRALAAAADGRGGGAAGGRRRVRMCRSVAAMEGGTLVGEPQPACEKPCMQRRLQAGRYPRWPMPVISSDPLANGLPIHRAPIPGTRATTVLVAFDAGARTE